MTSFGKYSSNVEQNMVSFDLSPQISLRDLADTHETQEYVYESTARRYSDSSDYNGKARQQNSIRERTFSDHSNVSSGQSSYDVVSSMDIRSVSSDRSGSTSHSHMVMSPLRSDSDKDVSTYRTIGGPDSILDDFENDNNISIPALLALLILPHAWLLF